LQRSVGGGTSTTGTSSGTVGNSVGQFQVGGSLSWRSTFGAASGAPSKSDAAAAQASAGTLAAARLSAQSSLATNYFSLRVSDRRRRLFEESVAAYARSLAIVNNKAAAGTVSRLDQIAGADDLRPDARATRCRRRGPGRSSSIRSRALIGKAPAEVSIAPEPLPPSVPTIDGGLPSALLERRPRHRVGGTQHGFRQRPDRVSPWRPTYPSITLGGSINSPAPC